MDNDNWATPTPKVKDRLVIAGWSLDEARHRLERGDESIRLEPKTIQLLGYLARHSGEPLSREALLKEIWPGVIVGDEALTNAVNKIRKAFGDDRQNPQIIETIPKMGYRLIVKVHTQPPGSEHSDTRTDPPQKVGVFEPSAQNKQVSSASPIGILRQWPAAMVVGIAVSGLALTMAVLLLSRELHDNQVKSEPGLPSVSGKPSVAVLPFVNLSDDPQQEYFIDGMTEDLITDLSKVSGLYVIARNSVFGYKGLTPTPQEVAQQLGVSYVLEGSVRKAAGRVRINVTFIDASTGLNLWAERFDGSLDDVFELQDHLARKIVSALAIQLTEKEQAILADDPTTNVEALEHYFLGRAYYGSASKQENDLSRKMFRRAIEADPEYAQAYAALALTYLDDQRRGWSTDPKESIKQALQLAQQAIDVDETVPQAHFALGYIYLYAKAQHDRALTEAKTALELDPNYADGYALISSAYMFSGYPERALHFDRKAMRLNPAASYLHYEHLGRSQYLQGSYREALEALQEGVKRNYNHIPIHLWLAATYSQMGDLDEAEWEVEQVLTLDPDFSLSSWLKTRPYKKVLHKEQLLDGLRKAGLSTDDLY